MRIQKTTVYVWLSLGCCLGYYLINGKHGIKKYRAIVQDVVKDQQKIKALNQEIAIIEAHINDWSKQSLIVESVLRTDLHMGYTNEMVYLYPKKIDKKKVP